MSVLSVRGLGKAFRTYKSEWHRLGRWFGLPFKPTAESWVLRNVSFDVPSGSAIGIVGQNGAGKSTLLKMITGTLQPTDGVVSVNGRIAAILELGMGFNPELTGRQNVRHAAGLMGFTALETEQAMPEIEAFAEIGKYFDETVRTYSSGMQVRVAFAIATAWRPEILIVDEALSVGDAYFQHKSFNRIREFQEQGTTLLIVSHDKGAIQSLCDRAILLEKGAVTKDGDPEQVLDYYNAIIAEKENKTVEVKEVDNGKKRTRSGTGEARVESISLHSDNEEVVEWVGVGERVSLKVKIKIFEDIDTLVFGYGIKDRLGRVMWGTNTWHEDKVLNDLKSDNEYEFITTFCANFGVGHYSVVVALHAGESHMIKNYEWIDLALVFHVVNKNKKKFEGCNWLEQEIRIDSL